MKYPCECGLKFDDAELLELHREARHSPEPEPDVVPVKPRRLGTKMPRNLSGQWSRMHACMQSLSDHYRPKGGA